MNVARLPIPASIEVIDTGWIEQALQFVADGKVSAIRTAQVSEGRGFAGEVFRVNIEWGEGDGPDSVVIKLHSQDEARRRQAFGAYLNEHQFYDRFAIESPVRAPNCYFSAVDETTAHFVLVLEDLVGVKFGDQVAGASLDEIRAAVEGLAAHHAAFWQREEVASLPREDNDVDPRELVGFLGELEADVRETFGRGLPLTLSVARLVVQSFAMPGFVPPDDTLPERFTLVHSDYRLDNMGYLPNGELVVIDWCCQPGSAHSDLAYFLAANMLPEQIMEHWHDIVAAYHAALREGGVRNYSLDHLNGDLREHLIGQTIVVIVGLGIFSRINRDGMPGNLSLLPPGVVALLENVILNPRGFEILMTMAERSESALAQVIPGGSVAGQWVMGSMAAMMNLKARFLAR